MTLDKKTTRMSYVTTKVKDCFVVYKAGKHPLHACKSFRASPHSKKVAIVKKNRLCINCLKPGHFVRSAYMSTDAKCVKVHTTRHSILTGAMKGN